MDMATKLLVQQRDEAIAEARVLERERDAALLRAERAEESRADAIRIGQAMVADIAAERDRLAADLSVLRDRGQS